MLNILGCLTSAMPSYVISVDNAVEIVFIVQAIKWKNKDTYVQLLNPYFCLFVFLFDFLHPINNISVIKGRVFLDRTSTKLGLMFLLKDTTQ